MARKYYWLKLKEDFFDDKYIKLLKKMPSGPDMVIIYLKLQLRSLKTDGLLKYDNLLPTCEEELAMIIDEPLELVRLTIGALTRMNLIEKLDNQSLYMIAMQELIGNESDSAKRVREFREKQKALQGCYNVTQECYINEQSNATTLNSNREIEKEKKIEKENNKASHRFTPPTLEEVTSYCKERNNTIDPEQFVDHYTSNGWMRGNTKIKDWKACVRTWEKRNNQSNTVQATPGKKSIVDEVE